MYNSYSCVKNRKIRLYKKYIRRRVSYIFSKKIKYYTKEGVKLTNIIIIGVLIISAIVLMKLKPVYELSIGEEVIGYIEDKELFEQVIDKKLNDNHEENIAFADFEMDTNYKFKFVEKQVEIKEEEVLASLVNYADITYFQYAVCVNGEEKEKFAKEEEAKEVVTNLNQQLGNEANVWVERIYTKELPVKSEVQLASVSDNLAFEIKEQVKQEQRRERGTINGVFMSVVPVKGNITSRYGDRESIRSHSHRGLDIAAKTGTPIKAAADGTVTYSGTMSGYGNLLRIDHGNGITTYYGHCSKLYKKEGEKVKAGDVIAAVGNTGNSTGSHLHFEIRRNGEYLNPAKYIF